MQCFLFLRSSQFVLFLWFLRFHTITVVLVIISFIIKSSLLAFIFLDLYELLVREMKSTFSLFPLPFSLIIFLFQFPARRGFLRQSLVRNIAFLRAIFEWYLIAGKSYDRPLERGKFIPSQSSCEILRERFG